MITPHTISYAQNREDLLLSSFFDDDEIGFYVDVGANDPVHESVTKHFYDKGWSGINIEPLPHLHKKLQKMRPRDHNLAVGVGIKHSSAELHYYPNGDGLSTLSEKMAELYQTMPNEFTRESELVTISIEPLSQILTKHAKGKAISFMKVDVEGFEYDVLASNDWNQFRPEVICIEANHMQKDWRKILITQHYKLVFFDGLNEYYTDEKTDRAKKFNYVRTIIFQEPIVNFRLLNDFQKYDAHIKWLEDTVKQQKAELATIRLEAERLQTHLEEIRSLRRHIKKAAKQRVIKLDSKVLSLLDKSHPYQAKELKTSSTAASQPPLNIIHDHDLDSFKAYNRPMKSSLLLEAYVASKKLVKKTYIVRRANGITRKKS